MQETVLNGRYQLGEVLGEGGMAVVYRGHDLLLNRPVAIKILRSQYAADENFLKRFEREAQAAAGFSHPNIVNVYDVGTDGDQHYIVMEYIRGPSLKDLIRRQGPFSVDGAIFIIGQVASALDYAHQRALVHRDIKPQNILVDRDGNAKVVDFGIAKGMRDVNLTEAGTGMGTVHYVSPEQARGDPAAPESDLYSTGVVLFEMLTKSLPFEADTPVGVAMQHVNAPPPAPSSINPSIPAPVDAIVLKALAKDPADRYPTGAQLAAALRHWDMPTLVRPATPPRADSGERATAPPRPNRATEAVRAAPLPPPARSGHAPPRSRTGQMRVPPPAPRNAARSRSGYTPPPPRTNQDDLGCATWLIGSAILLGIVGLIVVAFRLGPGVFANSPSSTPTFVAVTDATATATVTPAPDPPTPTLTPTPSPTPPPPPPPEPTPTVEPSPTPALEPTATEALLSVPNLVGSTLDDARGVVGDTLTLEISEEYSATPAGVILRQSPEPGTSLPPGSSVALAVSLGREYTSIPDVRGVEAETAQRRLEDLGFTVQIVEESHEDFAEGTVIRTDPAVEARTGSTVTMYVSLGDVAVVPNVFRHHHDEAVDELEEAGLTVGDVTPVSCKRIRESNQDFDCSDFPDGGVVYGSLDWGATVPAGARMDIAYYDEDL